MQLLQDIREPFTNRVSIVALDAFSYYHSDHDEFMNTRGYFFFIRNFSEYGKESNKAKRTCGESVGKKTRLDKGEVRGRRRGGRVQRRFRGGVAAAGGSANTAAGVLVVMVVMPG